MAENTVVVTLKVDDQMSQPIADASKKVDKSLSDSKDSFKSLGEELKGNFTNAIKGAVVAYLGMQGIQKITEMVKKSREEWREYVNNQTQLRTALGFTSKALADQADALGKKLVMDNDEIIKVQAMVANYVKSEDAVKKLTPAVLDLAVATGMDMATAANIVAKAINDDNGELGKFKIQIDGAKGSAERVDSVFRGLEEKFGNQAVKLAENKDGWDKLGVSINNAYESLGKFLFGLSKDDEATKKYEKAIISLAYNKAMIAKMDAADRAGKQIDYAVYGQMNAAMKANQKIIDDRTNSIIAATDANNAARKIEGDAQAKEAREARQKEQDEANKKLLEANKKTYEENYNAGKTALIELRDFQYEDAKISWEKQQALREMESVVLISNLNDKLDADEQRMFSESGLMEQKRRYTQEEKILAAQSIATSLGAAAAIFAGQQKYLALYKTLAIGQAIMDTYASANAVYKSAAATPIVGPILAPIAAGVAVVAGLANVAKITSQKAETGSAYIGGRTLVGERGPEIVTLPRGSQVYNNTQTRNMTTNTALTVNITDSSGNITETIRAQLRSGQGDQLVRDIQAKMARQL